MSINLTFLPVLYTSYSWWPLTPHTHSWVRVGFGTRWSRHHFISVLGLVLLPMPLGCIAAGVGRVFSRDCLSVCLFVRAPKGKWLELSTWAVNTKLGTRILHCSRLTCVHPEVKRSRSHGYENHYGRMVARDACCYGCCRRGSACRYDRVCVLVIIVIDIIIVVFIASVYMSSTSETVVMCALCCSRATSTAVQHECNERVVSHCTEWLTIPHWWWLVFQLPNLRRRLPCQECHWSAWRCRLPAGTSELDASDNDHLAVRI